jgi:hypothetical protein
LSRRFADFQRIPAVLIKTWQAIGFLTWAVFVHAAAFVYGLSVTGNRRITPVDAASGFGTAWDPGNRCSFIQAGCDALNYREMISVLALVNTRRSRCSSVTR